MPAFMPKNKLNEASGEFSTLLDSEFDEEEILAEPEGILFLLTDDPHHFNLT